MEYLFLIYLAIGFVLALFMRWFMSMAPKSARMMEVNKQLDRYADKAYMESLIVICFTLFWFPIIIWFVTKRRR